MPTLLSSLETRLQQRLFLLDSGFNRYLLQRPHLYRVDRSAFQEGYVSALWQVWCAFCRNLIICSAKGAETKCGKRTGSPYAKYGPPEIAYVAQRLSQQSKHERITEVKALAGDHKEHNWGDLKVITKVAGRIESGNESAMLSGFSACQHIRDLQTCRNASAHIGQHMLNEIESASRSAHYTNAKWQHPSDMMHWTVASSGNKLWDIWVNEIRLAADFAVR